MNRLLLVRRKFNRRKNFNPFSKIKIRNFIGKPDLVLLGTIFVILIFGLVMLTSASSIKSYREFNSTYYLFFHQIIFGLLPGTILFFILSLIILGLVFIPGLSLEIGETKSWLKIFGASVQPSEIIKLFLILSLAGWFSYRGREKNQDFWNGLIPFVFILGLISLPIALQRDLGTLVVVAVIALSIYFVAGAKISHL